MYILLHILLTLHTFIKKELLLTLFCMFLKSSKAFSVSFSWDAMLKMTDSKPDFIPDIEMY